MIYMHPRKLQEMRSAGLPVAGVPNFKCKCCKRSIYKFQGRKAHPRGGYVCAECVSQRNSVRADRGKENAEQGGNP